MINAYNTCLHVYMQVVYNLIILENITTNDLFGSDL